MEKDIAVAHDIIAIALQRRQADAGIHRGWKEKSLHLLELNALWLALA